MGTNTTILSLYKPDIDEVGWGALRNASYDTIDTALGTQHGLTGQHKFVTVDSGTGYIQFPSLTTAQRDALPVANGFTIYNTTTSTLQSYQNGSWQNVITSSITVEEQDFGPSVSGVTTLRFPDGTVTDIGGGVISIAGFVQDSEGVAVGDILYFDGSNWSRIAPGMAGFILQAAGVGNAPQWVLPGSGGNVSTALAIADNALVRGDGGVVGVQASGILIDDSDNVTGVVNLTTTGTITFNTVTYTFPAVQGGVGTFLQNDGAGNLVWAAATVTPEFADNVFRIQDNVDPTAEIAFEAGAITTGTVRTITMPDTDVDLGDIATNNAKVTNATHTGEVTGSGALTVDPTAITNKTTVTPEAGDFFLFSDTSDAGALKKADASDLLGASLTQDVNQVAHGFSVNDWVYHNGTIYALADASSAITAESIGVVSAVAGVDDFTIQFGGYITGLSGLTAGATHYLSETPGQITATAPSTVGAVVKPVLIADSTTSGYIFNMLGTVVTAATMSSNVLAFTNADLVAGVLTHTHNLGEQYGVVQIYDNTDSIVQPDDITATDSNTTTIDLSSFGVIAGTWHSVVHF